MPCKKEDFANQLRATYESVFSSAMKVGARTISLPILGYDGSKTMKTCIAALLDGMKEIGASDTCGIDVIRVISKERKVLSAISRHINADES